FDRARRSIPGGDLAGGFSDLGDDRLVHWAGEHDRRRGECSRQIHNYVRSVDHENRSDRKHAHDLDQVAQSQRSVASPSVTECPCKRGRNGGGNELDHSYKARRASTASVETQTRIAIQVAHSIVLKMKKASSTRRSDAVCRTEM